MLTKKMIIDYVSGIEDDLCFTMRELDAEKKRVRSLEKRILALETASCSCKCVKKETKKPAVKKTVTKKPAAKKK